MSGRLHSIRLSVSCTLLGIAIISLGIFLAFQVEKQKSWSPAMAQIAESEWEESGEEVGVRIRVEYEVDRRQLKQSFFIKDWANDHEGLESYGPFSIAPESIPRIYQPGAEIQRLYDPEKVDSAVLTAGDHWMNVYAILFGLGLVCLGLLSPIHSFLIWRADRMTKPLKREMLEFITNIQDCEKMLDDCSSKQQRDVLAKRHQAMIEQFAMLYGDYEEIVQELEEAKTQSIVA
ncbi:MAG: DUF3592 domain-containing protein [Planctomycetota bacterium]